MEPPIILQDVGEDLLVAGPWLSPSRLQHAMQVQPQYEERDEHHPTSRQPSFHRWTDRWSFKIWEYIHVFR